MSFSSHAVHLCPHPLFHTSDDEQLVALYALGVLDERERQSFEAHLFHCEACGAMLVQNEQTLARLALATPGVEPQPGSRLCLLYRAAEELRANG